MLVIFAAKSVLSPMATSASWNDNRVLEHDCLSQESLGCDGDNTSVIEVVGWHSGQIGTISLHSPHDLPPKSVI